MFIKIPELTEVKSSCVKSVGYYDSDLYVKFRSGSIYKYKNVEKSIYESLLKSESKGKFITLNIIPKYDYDYLV